MKIAIVSASVRSERLSHRAALLLEQNLTEMGHSVSMIDLKYSDFTALVFVLDKNPDPSADYLSFRKYIQDSDALLFVSPEYNGSYTAPLKNLVDHLGKTDFAKKVIGIAVPTTGVMGGMRAALALQALILAIWALPIPQMLLVPEVHKKIDDLGTIIDPNFQKQVEQFVKEFLWASEAILNHKK
jgi:NAD(P)H-dependent FMN reductase